MAKPHALRSGRKYGELAVHRSTGQKGTTTKKKHPEVVTTKPKRPQVAITKPCPKITKGKSHSDEVCGTVSPSAVKTKGCCYSVLRRRGLRGEPLVCLRDVRGSMESLIALHKEFQDLYTLIKARSPRVTIREKVAKTLRDRHYKYNIRLSSRAHTTFKYRERNGENKVFHLADHISNIDDWCYFCKLLHIPQCTVDAWETEFGGSAEECWRETMKTWLDEEIMTRYPVSWAGMIDLLNDSTCPKMSAQKLRHALHLVPSQEAM